MRAFGILVLILSLCASTALATVFGTVRGIVHDPQHRPIAGATVVLKAADSDFSKTTASDAQGEFTFDAVPAGSYSITVSSPGFATQEEPFTILSGASPTLHLELQIASQNQRVTVTGEAAPAQTESVTPTTLISRSMLESTPSAMQTNSLTAITDYVPGSYFTHDQLHVRGGHQVTWLIDGVPIPNTNIASNLGPQIDPKDMDELEVQRGSYAADYGDRTYGIFDVVPRTGFDTDNQGELIVNAGNFYQTDDQINFGSHTSNFAYYASLNGNRTDLGLQPPTPEVIHDAANGYGGFTSLMYNVDPQDQLRLVGQVRRDYYQVPFDPNNVYTEGQFLADANQETDSFVAFSWVHTFDPGLVLTVSPSYHYNSVNYSSSPLDIPSSTTQDRTSKYEGGQAAVSWVKDINNLRAGVFSFAQQDYQLFALTFNDGSSPNLTPQVVTPLGSLVSAFVEDQIKPTSWLTLDGGVRQTHFSGVLTENATSPRVGLSVRIPKLNWVLRGFFGDFYQAPPLETVTGPLLEFVDTENLGFIPLKGERDQEHQFGLTIPFRGWVFDADTFQNLAQNFFDHNNLNNSDVFFPITIQGARIDAWELTVRSPRIRHRAQAYLTYSNQLALGFGAINGGLTNFVPPAGYFALDHDQRNTLHVGASYSLPWRITASTDTYYGSGFSNGNAALYGQYLQSHTTFDFLLGKNFGESFSANVQCTNCANTRVLLDNSLTFGGTHWLNPREVLVQLRLRFHY
jgi:hypothetical protein